MEEIRKKIKEKGLLKGWIANKLNIPQSTLSSYLNETRTIPDEVKKELVKILY